MKRYTKPQADIIKLKSSDVTTASAPATLLNKGENGTPAKESFSSLFGR